jgi:two-component system sensor histidine kinase BaeS
VKLGIQYRLFLTLLTATAAVVLCMLLIVQWSIDRGFLQYVNTVEQERLENLAAELEQVYGERGNWEFLREEPVAWLRLLGRSPSPGLVEPEQLRRWERRLEQRQEQRQEPGPPREPRAPSRSQIFERRVVLLDADRRPLSGPADLADTVELRPLRVAGAVVGYLGLAPRKGLYDAYQLRFVEQQQLALALIAGATLLVSGLLSFPLARRLVRPLRALAAATYRLTAGEYATRVPGAGSDELGQLARDFNTLALTLEKNEQARRQWVADISHELRTPLAVLRGEIEALQDGVRQPTATAVASLHAEVMHLGRLVEDLYQLSLSDFGALNYRKEEVDLAGLLADTLESFRAEFATKGLTPGLTPPAGDLTLFADPERLRQLFANLVENSLKYTDPGGRLEVVLKRDGSRAVVSFSDSAPGVPAADLERLFERFYRVEGSRSRASGGAGLGLAICRNIVEAHGGTIAAGPSTLGGVTLTVTLPLAGANR